ncbi:hypothetical protein JOF48_000546 [Arthrobacter stackebrandtii]|uniref:Uncharacterized protein n=1 Tax=Arthrobacter stackebrandtii TaxID=272161 RepID=A0ABS4YTN6_9MICC|nr:hypothetical protein [Arthrobacter stackebrandtii]MBP2411747.1 hypothetical protein [Arthrobacter stackebrandtii]PYG99144.1 hypothetical protein CVV67_16435 [Arthrobacter stackebrandtii]
MSSTATRRKRSILWGILCAVGGWALFAIPFLYGMVLLVWGGYGLSMSQSSGDYDWAELLLLLGVGIAMLGMLISPVICGMAVVTGRRSQWLAGAIFALPAVICACAAYILWIGELTL